MTVTLADGLLFVIAATLLVMAAQLLRLMRRIEKLDEAIEEVRELVYNAEAALLEARKTGARIDAIVETVEQGARLVRRVVMPFAWRVAALSAGAKAGLGVLRQGGFRHSNGAGAARGGVQ